MNVYLKLNSVSKTNCTILKYKNRIKSQNKNKDQKIEWKVGKFGIKENERKVITEKKNKLKIK